MLVCIDKITCVRMHGLIERYWRERIAELEAEHAKARGEQEAIYLRRQIAWMRETRAAVVVSEEQGEVEKFRGWDLDIVPHRRLIKEGMELPAAMLKFVQELEQEESRALREGLDEESLAVFDLLTRPDLGRTDIERIKKVAKELLRTLKTEKLRVDHWRETEATQSAVKVAIRDFLYADETGLPDGAYSDDDVMTRSEAVFAHVYGAYPTVPSPCYDGITAA